MQYAKDAQLYLPADEAARYQIIHDKSNKQHGSHGV